MEGLGRASIVIGVAELASELTFVFAGHRASIWTIVIVLFGGGTAFFLTLLAVVSASLSWNLALLFVAFYINEMQIVAALAAGCTIVPKAQSALFVSLNASNQVSRFLAALAAVPLWSAGGMVATVWVAWACQLAGLLFAVLLRRNIRRASRASHRVVVSTHRGSSVAGRSSLRPRPSATASTVLVSASCSPYDVACPAEPVGLALLDIDH